MSVSDKNLSVVSAAIFRENFGEQPWVENGERLAADWRYRRHVKNCRILTRVQYGLFQR